MKKIKYYFHEKKRIASAKKKGKLQVKIHDTRTKKEKKERK